MLRNMRNTASNPLRGLDLRTPVFGGFWISALTTRALGLNHGWALLLLQNINPVNHGFLTEYALII